MKTYTVYFTEPVAVASIVTKWVNENGEKHLRDVEETEYKDVVEFYTLAAAKKLIKANLNKYKGSCITKYWANGEWENLGEIKLKGSNKTFVANTRQKVANY